MLILAQNFMCFKLFKNEKFFKNFVLKNLRKSLLFEERPDENKLWLVAQISGIFYFLKAKQIENTSVNLSFVRHFLKII